MHGDEGGVASNGQGPRAVPDLGIPDSFGQVPAPRAAPPVPAPDLAAVTDEDRQAYGRLLDRAFERGLIGSYDYEVRLRELSEATSIDAMKAIVTELPMFAVPAPGASRTRGPLGRGPAGGSGNRKLWTRLVIMAVAVAVAFVVLALYAEHVVHSRTNGNGGAPATATTAPAAAAATSALPVRFPRP